LTEEELCSESAFEARKQVCETESFTFYADEVMYVSSLTDVVAFFDEMMTFTPPNEEVVLGFNLGLAEQFKPKEWYGEESKCIDVIRECWFNSCEFEKFLEYTQLCNYVPMGRIKRKGTPVWFQDMYSYESSLYRLFKNWDSVTKIPLYREVFFGKDLMKQSYEEWYHKGIKNIKKPMLLKDDGWGKFSNVYDIWRQEMRPNPRGRMISMHKLIRNHYDNVIRIGIVFIGLRSLLYVFFSLFLGGFFVVTQVLKKWISYMLFTAFTVGDSIKKILQVSWLGSVTVVTDTGELNVGEITLFDEGGTCMSVTKAVLKYLLQIAGVICSTLLAGPILAVLLTLISGVGLVKGKTDVFRRVRNYFFDQMNGSKSTFWRKVWWSMLYMFGVDMPLEVYRLQDICKPEVFKLNLEALQTIIQRQGNKFTPLPKEKLEMYEKPPVILPIDQEKPDPGKGTQDPPKSTQQDQGREQTKKKRKLEQKLKLDQTEGKYGMKLNYGEEKSGSLPKVEGQEQLKIVQKEETEDGYTYFRGSEVWKNEKFYTFDELLTEKTTYYKTVDGDLEDHFILVEDGEKCRYKLDVGQKFPLKVKNVIDLCKILKACIEGNFEYFYYSSNIKDKVEKEVVELMVCITPESSGLFDLTNYVADDFVDGAPENSYYNSNLYIESYVRCIEKRVQEYGGTLVCEVGGKMFDDGHASRVIPGFVPLSKLRVIRSLSVPYGLVLTIKNKQIVEKVRGDTERSYGDQMIYELQMLKHFNFVIDGVVVGCVKKGEKVDQNFKNSLTAMGIKIYETPFMVNYPYCINNIMDDTGMASWPLPQTDKNKKLIFVFGVGPDSCKLATCTALLRKMGKEKIKSRYFKFETFPICEIKPEEHLNRCYAYATADAYDKVTYDPHHYFESGELVSNYNRDLAGFNLLNEVHKESDPAVYIFSPTQLAMNLVMSGYGGIEEIRNLSDEEIWRRLSNPKFFDNVDKPSKSNLDLLFEKVEPERRSRFIGYVTNLTNQSLVDQDLCLHTAFVKDSEGTQLVITGSSYMSVLFTALSVIHVGANEVANFNYFVADYVQSVRCILNNDYFKAQADNWLELWRAYCDKCGQSGEMVNFKNTDVSLNFSPSARERSALLKLRVPFSTKSCCVCDKESKGTACSFYSKSVEENEKLIHRFFKDNLEKVAPKDRKGIEELIEKYGVIDGSTPGTGKCSYYNRSDLLDCCNHSMSNASVGTYTNLVKILRYKPYAGYFYVWLKDGKIYFARDYHRENLVGKIGKFIFVSGETLSWLIINYKFMPNLPEGLMNRKVGTDLRDINKLHSHTYGTFDETELLKDRENIGVDLFIYPFAGSECFTGDDVWVSVHSNSCLIRSDLVYIKLENGKEWFVPKTKLETLKNNEHLGTVRYREVDRVTVGSVIKSTEFVWLYEKHDRRKYVSAKVEDIVQKHEAMVKWNHTKTGVPIDMEKFVNIQKIKTTVATGPVARQSRCWQVLLTDYPREWQDNAMPATTIYEALRIGKASVSNEDVYMMVNKDKATAHIVLSQELLPHTLAGEFCVRMSSFQALIFCCLYNLMIGGQKTYVVGLLIDRIWDTVVKVCFVFTWISTLFLLYDVPAILGLTGTIGAWLSWFVLYGGYGILPTLIVLYLLTTYVPLVERIEGEAAYRGSTYIVGSSYSMYRDFPQGNLERLEGMESGARRTYNKHIEVLPEQNPCSRHTFCSRDHVGEACPHLFAQNESMLDQLLPTTGETNVCPIFYDPEDNYALALKEKFRDLNFIEGKFDKNPHSHAALWSQIARAKCVRDIGEGERVLVVGSNPSFYPKSGYVHLMPYMDGDDAYRYEIKTKFLSSIEQLGEGIEYSTKTLEEVEGQFTCAIFVHSCYDIPFETAMFHMHRLGIRKVYNVMDCSVDALTLQNSFLPDQNVHCKVEEDTISFTQAGNLAKTYSHNFTNYKKWALTSEVYVNSTLYYGVTHVHFGHGLAVTRYMPTPVRSKTRVFFNDCSERYVFLAIEKRRVAWLLTTEVDYELTWLSKEEFSTIMSKLATSAKNLSTTLPHIDTTLKNKKFRDLTITYKSDENYLETIENLAKGVGGIEPSWWKRIFAALGIIDPDSVTPALFKLHTFKQFHVEPIIVHLTVPETAPPNAKVYPFVHIPMLREPKLRFKSNSTPCLFERLNYDSIWHISGKQINCRTGLENLYKSGKVAIIGRYNVFCSSECWKGLDKDLHVYDVVKDKTSYVRPAEGVKAYLRNQGKKVVVGDDLQEFEYLLDYELVPVEAQECCTLHAFYSKDGIPKAYTQLKIVDLDFLHDLCRAYGKDIYWKGTIYRFDGSSDYTGQCQISPDDKINSAIDRIGLVDKDGVIRPVRHGNIGRDYVPQIAFVNVNGHAHLIYSTGGKGVHKLYSSSHHRPVEEFQQLVRGKKEESQANLERMYMLGDTQEVLYGEVKKKLEESKCQRTKSIFEVLCYELLIEKQNKLKIKELLTGGKKRMRNEEDVVIYDRVRGELINKAEPMLGFCRYLDERYEEVKVNVIFQNKFKLECETSGSRYIFWHKNFEYIKSRRLIERYVKGDIFPCEDIEGVAVTLVNGVPGCGKTYEIAQKYSPGKTLILTATVRGKDNINKHLELRGFRKKLYKKDVHTLDSFIIHESKLKQYEKLFVDEALMLHSGDIYIAALLCKAKEIYCYGDVRQIPFIARSVFFECHYSELNHNELEERNTSYRLNPETCKILQVPYPRIEPIKFSHGKLSYEVIPNMMNYDLTGWDCCTFTQFEKIRMKNEFNVYCFTIHERQGDTVRNMCGIRLMPQDNPIYTSRSHVIVMLSRHTENFKYCTCVYDEVCKLLIAGDWSAMKSNERVVPTSKQFSKTNCDIIEYEGEKRAELDPERPEVILLLGSEYHEYSYPEVFYRTLRRIYEETEDLKVPYLKGIENTIPDVIRSLFNYVDIDGMIELESKMPTAFPSGSITDIGDFYMLPDLRGLQQPTVELNGFGFVDNLESFTQQRVIHSLLQRNIQVNRLADMRVGVEAREVARTWFDTFIDKTKMDEYVQNHQCYNLAQLDGWFNSRDTNYKERLKKDIKGEYTSVEDFTVDSKKNLKAKMDGTNTVVPAVGQIYTAPHPFWVAKTIMMLKYIDGMMKECLVDGWSITDGINLEELEGELNYITNKGEHQFVAIDISKFDKSQDNFCVQLQSEILRLLGIDETFINFWEKCHYESNLSFARCHMLFKTGAQRRSGESFTLLFNSIINMAALAYCFDLKNDCHGGMICGDDSLLIFKNKMICDISDMLSRGFNFFGKYEDVSKAVYYVGKFILRIGEKYRVVPDILKQLVKLTRKDIRNKIHLEECFTAMRDMMRFVNSVEVIEELGQKTMQLYSKLNWEYDFCDVLFYFKSVLTDFKRFEKMFQVNDQIKYKSKGKTIDKDLMWKRKFHSNESEYLLEVVSGKI